MGLERNSKFPAPPELLNHKRSRKAFEAFPSALRDPNSAQISDESAMVCDTGAPIKRIREVGI
jgi:hypothetical protein